MSLDDYSTWGQFLRFAGRPKEALKKYELMLNIDEHSSEAFLGLGFAFQQLGKIDDAMKMFDKARENDVTGEIALASLLVQNGKVNEGLSHYTKASEVNADSVYLLTAWADSLVNIAKSDQELDKPKVVEAIDKYKRAALLNPWLVSTYQSMKAACGLVGDNGGVEECVDETNRIQEAIRKVIDQYQIIQTINGL
jgi:tetratricopeptide (TPR) repeat protein